MESEIFYNNIYSKNRYSGKLIILLTSLFIVNYIAKSSGSVGSTSFLAFIVLEVLLIFLDPLYAFVFSFVINLNIIGCLDQSWIQPASFCCMFFVFIKNPKSLFSLFKDKKLKTILNLQLLLVFFLIIINVGFKSGFNWRNFIISFGYIFGFLTILPVYYFTCRRPKDLLVSLTFVTALFLFIYYLDLIKGLGIFNLQSYLHLDDSTMERLAGYDIRQFMIFFTYLIPACIFVNNINKLSKYFLIAIGIFSYIVLILAFYRLAMFYVFMGAALSYISLRKYNKEINVFKYLFLLIILVTIASFFFEGYFTEIKNIAQITIDYFIGKGDDNSADARFEMQLPILSKLFFSNPWTGCGLIEIKKFYSFDMFGFVDFPILGTLSAFGIIGMLLYYLKFIILLSGTKKVLNTHDVDKKDPFTFYLYLTLKAYFITMISFRLFYISWELTFDYMQVEFGMFSGVYLALSNILVQQNNQDEEVVYV